MKPRAVYPPTKRAAPVIAAALAVCAAAPASAQPAQGVRGPEVSNVCFNRNINNWREMGRGQLLIERGVDDWFLVEMSGGCDAGLSRLTIAIEDRGGGGCLDAGDRITFSDGAITRQCTVRRIYEWDEDGESEPYGGK